MDVPLYFEVNLLCAAVLIFIGVKRHLSGYFYSTKDCVFDAVLACLLAVNIFDAAEEFYKFIPRTAIYIIEVLYFSAFAVGAYFWYVYADLSGTDRGAERKKRLHRRLFQALPLFLLLAVLVISCFDGCIFMLDGNNKYHRGAFFFLQPVTAYAYLAASVIRSLSTCVKKTAFWRHDEVLSNIICAAAVSVAGTAQLIVPESPFLIAGASVAALIIYVNSLEGMVSLDPLTSLPNRRELMSTLNEKMRSLRAGEKLSFLFMDVDGFKQINDTLGHSEGDRILKELAKTIKEYCRQTGGYCARMSGDELAVIKIHSSERNTDTVCREIEEYIARRNLCAGAYGRVTLSIGCSDYPGDAESAGELISQADDAMYTAKQAKKKQCI